MRKYLTLILLVVLSAVMATTALAKGEVSWTVSQIEGSATPNGNAVIVLQAAIQPGWHLYSVVPVQDGPFPTTFSTEDLTLTDSIIEEPLHKEFDKGFNKDINLFKDKATFWVPVKFGAKGVGGKLSVMFQVCKDGVCIPPQPVEFDLKSAKVVTESTKPAKQAEPIVAASAVVKEGPTGLPNEGKKKGEVPDIDDAKSKGVLAYLWLAVSAGFLALLTPCVFPMIPITVSFFSKKKEGESSLQSALLYCAGIIGTFTFLGIGVSIIFGATGLSRLANNPYMNLVLALVFIVLALSLFGVFELALPSKFVNRFDSAGKSKYVAPIFMGLTFSLTSFTCTLPFVGAVLVGAANGGWFYPMVGMLGFSTAFCIPFMLLALFPEALSKLPKSGAWMVTVKAFMGFIELIAAVKFLSTVDLSFELGLITRETNLALWFMLLVIAAIYLFGWIRLPKVYDGKIGPLRIAFGVGTMLLALKIAAAMNGGALGSLEGFLPPSPYPGKETAMAPAWEKDFLPDFEAAKAKAKENGKPIFIDFTGIYCTNCRVMERTVFPSAKVQAAFQKFNKVSLYTDRTLQAKYKESDSRNAALQQQLVGTATLPTYVIVKPDGTSVVGSVPFTDSVDAFADWLEKSAH
jgi:thiol:disulfide interchange protein DsbD